MSIPVCLALLWTSLAEADVHVRATTLVSATPELVNPARTLETTVPVFELVGLSVRRLQLPGFDDVAIAIDGWASWTPQGSDVDGDVNLAFIEGLTFKKHLKLRLGRQLLLGGGTRLLALDGLMAEVRAPYGFGLSAYAGNPVVRRFSNYTHGDFVTGGRAFFAPTPDLQAGVSLVHLSERAVVLRQDLGVDARWSGLRFVTLAGNLQWSLADRRLAELDLGVRFQPVRDVEVNGGWRRTAPDLFLPRDSIFTVFADSQRDDLGGTVAWQATRMLSVVADARAIWLAEQAGYDAALGAALRPSRAAGTSLTLQARRLSVPVNGYSQARLGGRYTLPIGLSVYADLDLYVLDQPVRSTRTSFSYALGATWALGSRWLLGLSVLGGTSPYFERHTEAMFKVSWAVPEVRP